MKKSELITAVASAAGQSKEVTERIVDALGEVVQGTLRSGDEITLPGIGKLSVTERAARTGRNPQTGAELQIAAKKAPKFTAAKVLKDALQ